jgi:two-component system response regulator BaeR
MQQTILIAEDEPRLAKLLSDYLQQAGYASEWIADGKEVVTWTKDNGPDMILLDLMLPNKDGLEICKEIRTFSQVPIIMVTARVEEIDRLLGLELGADDYICKPFSPREVVARVKTVLRRTTPQTENNPQQLLTLDETSYTAILQGEKLDLTAVEFKLLSILAQKPGRIYSRDQLMDLLYSDQRVVCDRTIDSHIKKLRKKIATVTADMDLIHSIYGVGYKYQAP